MCILLGFVVQLVVLGKLCRGSTETNKLYRYSTELTKRTSQYGENTWQCVKKRQLIWLESKQSVAVAKNKNYCTQNKIIALIEFSNL
jgi:hypothetical protein